MHTTSIIREAQLREAYRDLQMIEIDLGSAARDLDTAGWTVMANEMRRLLHTVREQMDGVEAYVIAEGWEL